MGFENWSREQIEADKPYWVGFNVFSGVGPGIFSKLLSYFKTAKEAWGAGGVDLAPILGEKVWERFAEFRRKFEPEGYIGEIYNIRVLILPEEGYPKLLRKIWDAPFVLYVLGNKKILLKPQVAVVGTRRMTDYGARVARKLTAGLVYAGFTITSGLAYGIDTIAHRTALDEDGETIAVLGCGVDICYPADHIRIYERIANSGKGAVISEIPPGIRTNRGIFVARNRIISGLSLGVLVVEGAKKSGTLITAGYAAEHGREVFAVPGPITNIESDGPNLLIKEGAKVVRGVEDILGELKLIGEIWEIRVDKGKDKNYIKDKIKGLGEEEKKVFEVLAENKEREVHIDKIIRRTGFGSGKVGSIISALEIKGIIRDYGEEGYGLA